MDTHGHGLEQNEWNYSYRAHELQQLHTLITNKLHLKLYQWWYCMHCKHRRRDTGFWQSASIYSNIHRRETVATNDQQAILSHAAHITKLTIFKLILGLYMHAVQLSASILNWHCLKIIC